MNLIHLQTLLSERLKQPLPGALAHEPMRAIAIGPVKPNFKHLIPPKPGGVLIVLYEENGLLKFPLIKRPVYAGAHSGQVSLPGGKTEPGEDPINTALREGQEEIGVEPSTLKVLGCLSDFFVMPSNFLVKPVIAIAESVPHFVPDAIEVDRILHARVDDLMANDAVQEKEIVAGGQFTMRAPHFIIDGEIVWGATAMMLNEFRMVVQDIL